MYRRDFLSRCVSVGGTLAATRLHSAPVGAMPSELTVSAVGDCIITRRVSQIRDPRFLELAKLLRETDCAVGNCEITFGHARELEPTPKGTDMNLICEPHGAEDLAWMGFDLLGCANNHAMDYGGDGVRSTLRHLERVGIAAAGTGSTLAAAAAPGYADTPAGRIAMVNCAATFPDWSRAQYSRVDSNGRAGVNPLRNETTYQLSSDLFEKLKTVRDALFTNPAVLPTTLPAADELRFAGGRFFIGETGTRTAMRVDDIARATDAVRVARRNARLVVVMVHSHAGFRPANMRGDTLQTFARACIDAGADIFVNAGPHVLHGIEIYQGKPVFYSLGNFFFQYETLKQIPAEVYEANRLDIHSPDPSVSYDKFRFTRDKAFWESVVPKMTFNGTQLKELTLHPVVLGLDEERFARGLPVMADAKEGQAILERLVKMSAELGTKIAVRNGVGSVTLTSTSAVSVSQPLSRG